MEFCTWCDAFDSSFSLLSPFKLKQKPVNNTRVSAEHTHTQAHTLFILLAYYSRRIKFMLLKMSKNMIKFISLRLP